MRPDSATRGAPAGLGTTRTMGLVALIVAVVVFALIAGISIATQAGTMPAVLVFTQPGGVVDATDAREAGLDVVSSAAALETTLLDNINIRAVVLTEETARDLGSETMARLYNRGIIIAVVGVGLRDAQEMVGLALEEHQPEAASDATALSILGQFYCTDSGSQSSATSQPYENEQALADILERYIASIDCNRQPWLPLAPGP